MAQGNGISVLLVATLPWVQLLDTSRLLCQKQEKSPHGSSQKEDPEEEWSGQQPHYAMLREEMSE